MYFWYTYLIYVYNFRKLLKDEYAFYNVKLMRKKRLEDSSIPLLKIGGFGQISME